MYSILVKSSHPEVFLRKGVLKICSKFTGEHPCQSAIENVLRHGRSSVNSLHIFRTPFLKNTLGQLLLNSQFIEFGNRSLFEVIVAYRNTGNRK